MRPVLVAGITAVTLGFISVLDRGIAGLFDLGYLFVTFVGIVAGTMGVYLLHRRRKTPRELTTFDDPESRYRSAVPGEGLDERIAKIAIESRIRTVQPKIRDRIRDAAIQALIVHAGYDLAAAQAAVDEGTWTNDPMAAVFLSRNSSYPPGMRLKAFFGRVDPSTIGARRSIEAIADVIDP